jgi:uncharacterized protein YndB with AHSA1/START domain
MSATRGDLARATVRVAAPQALAFDVFTREIDLWWKRGPKFRHSGKRPGILHLEPHVDGRIFEEITAEQAIEVGRVRVWEPPARLVFSWRNATFAPNESTEVEVQFQPSGDGTLVIVEHRGWSTLRKDHPAKHGLDGLQLSGMIGGWWAELITAMGEHVQSRV